MNRLISIVSNGLNATILMFLDAIAIPSHNDSQILSKPSQGFRYAQQGWQSFRR